MQTQRVMVYLDGYNFYYSRLRGTAFKWLDVVALFRDQILKPQLPAATLTAVKYFTAPAMAKFASHGADSVTAQNEYHRALKAKHPQALDIILGYPRKSSCPRKTRKSTKKFISMTELTDSPNG